MIKSITASIIQGSSVGPAAYVVNASDLNAVTPGNQLCKFVDDTYLVVPASNVESRAAEIGNIEKWARGNNLTLNRNKSKENVFSDCRRRLHTTPPTMTDIVHVTSVKILGVTMTNGLSASEHVRASRDRVRKLYTHCESCEHMVCFRRRCRPSSSQSQLPSFSASSVWSGFIKAIDRQRVDGFLSRSVRCGYCSPNVPTFSEQCATADEQYFEKICSNSNHMLHRLLPPPLTASQNYNLRPRQ